MASKKTIGILTGGGDVPGLNSVIKTIVYGSSAHGGYEVLGIRRGWEGLTHLDDNEDINHQYIVPLDRQNTRSIDRTGGTFLHTSRTNPSKLPLANMPKSVHSRAERLKQIKPGIVDATPLVLENLQKLKIDHLVAIGGDDTLGYASVLNAQGVPIVAVPKTMDNDVRDTEYCVGFSTAMTRAESILSRVRTTLGSHERTGIFRIFGRDSGFTALYAAYVTSIRCCIPEVKFELNTLVDLLMHDRRDNPSRYAMVIFSEGATWTGTRQREYGAPDLFGHRKKVNIAEAFAAEYAEMGGGETAVIDLTYELRSGEPDFVDKMVASSFATMAFDCIASGANGRMMAIRNGCYTDTPIPNVSLGPRLVDADNMYDRTRFRPNYTSKQGLPIFMTKA
ncbi:MAG: 6-phosphofructokinase [Phycisphaeraceae bacterium]|nr:6-phosphofructokinase [Phycisphaeraceae bacterium]